MKMKKEYLMMAMLGLVVAAAAFFVGMQVGKKSGGRNFVANGNFQMRQENRGQNSQPGNRGTTSGMAPTQKGFQPVMGEVTSVDSTSVTVKMADGSSKIILLSDSTSYRKTTESKSADVTVGTKVTVIGTSNADGSVTAQSLMLGDFAAPSGSAAPQLSPAAQKQQ